MGRIIDLRPDSATAQIAGVVLRWIVLPGNLLGRQRTVKISPECVAACPAAAAALARVLANAHPECTRGA